MAFTPSTRYCPVRHSPSFAISQLSPTYRDLFNNFRSSLGPLAGSGGRPWRGSRVQSPQKLVGFSTLKVQENLFPPRVKFTTLCNTEILNLYHFHQRFHATTMTNCKFPRVAHFPQLSSKNGRRGCSPHSAPLPLCVPLMRHGRHSILNCGKDPGEGHSVSEVFAGVQGAGPLAEVARRQHPLA